MRRSTGAPLLCLVVGLFGGHLSSGDEMVGEKSGLPRRWGSEIKGMRCWFPEHGR